MNVPDPLRGNETAEEIRALREELLRPKPNGAAQDDWPEPESLGSELPPVPSFPAELLPESLRPWCEDIAERMQVPLDFPAITAFAALGAAVMRRAMIQPKELDTSWTEHPNPWGAVVADPGLMKTPLMNAITAPLYQIEYLWHAEYESEVANAKTSNELAELKKRAWEQLYVAAKRKGAKEAELPIQPDDSICEPRRKRLLTSDATFEKLHEIMAENPAGMACWRDELSGWMASLEKPGRESERAFYLEGWSGHSGFTIDRIGRGSIHVPHCCISVFGGIQPARMRNYLADVITDKPSNDGLMQRFGLLTWPDFSGRWRYVDRLPNATYQQDAHRVYQRLARLDIDSPLRLKFDRFSQALFKDWLTDLETKLRCEDTPPVLRGHFAKYRKLMPAVALLSALADGATDVVPEKAAKRAAALTEYLEPHARRVYSSRLTPEMAGAQTLARKLKSGFRGEEEGWFRLRDVYRRQWTGLTTPEEARLALQVLVEYGWLRKSQILSGEVGGRPSEIYWINPKIKGAKP